MNGTLKSQKHIVRNQWIRLVAFALTAVLMVEGLSVFSLRSLRVMYNYEPFYELPENSVDVVILGSSTAYCGFSPLRLYEQYGISAYNLCSSNQSMYCCYLWAKEAYEHQKYSVLLLEAGSISVTYPDLMRDIRSLHSMRKSRHYYELVKLYRRSSYQVLFPVFLFHSSWKGIRDYHYQKDPNPEKDFMRGYEMIVGSRSGYSGGFLVDEAVEEKASLDTTYLDKLVLFCEDNGIEMIIARTPVGDENLWSSEIHNSVAAYAKEHQLAFLDFNLPSLAEEAGIVLSEHLTADNHHMNIEGAHKLTDYLGEYLTTETAGRDLPRYQCADVISAEILEKYERIYEKRKRESME